MDRTSVSSGGASHFPDRFLTAILFIDVVDSTSRAAQLGDGKWTELMHAYESLVRTEIARWGGHEVDSAGDGSFATFDIPARAIGCAWTIGRRSEGLGLAIRAGVHVGECERQAGNVRGLAVHVGARVAAKARPDEILISKTVRALIQGSDIRLRERGSHVLKGVPGRWHLFAVEAMGEDLPGDEGRAMQPPIGVLLVDDHPLWRQTLRGVLENEDSIAVVGEARDGQEAIDACHQRRPDVVLMDMNLELMHGIEATQRISEELPDLKVLVLSSTDERESVLAAVDAGASGYLLKTAGANEIVAAIERINMGELVFPAGLSQVVLSAIRRRDAFVGEAS
ncbi:MAG TPA: response regulator [Actinomycetota bacterium]|nr:response regulator [Actinomycetota bacterium]